MKFLFAPAIALANHLRYTQKFVVAGLLMLVSVTVLFTGLYRGIDANIAATRSEMDGITAVTPLLRTVQLLQQHRGLSAGLLGGNAAMNDKRAAKQGEVDAAFAALEDKLSAALRGHDEWKSIRDKWSRLKAEGLAWALAENTGFHTALLGDMLIFVATAADHYALTLDPDIDSYYVMDTATNRVPLALERLGQMRAMGTGILAQKAASDQQRVGLSRATGEMQGNMRLLLINVAKVARYNPSLAAVLPEQAREATAAADSIANVIAADILSGAFATDPQAYFEQATVAIDKGYKLIYDVLLPTLSQLLEQRLARDRYHLWLQFGGMSALLLLLAYFFAGMYYSISGNVRLLASQAAEIAAGNLRARVRLDTRDELVAVADGFNKMADAVAAAMREVTQGAQSVAEEANRLAGTAAEIATASSSQSQSAAAMAATVEEVTVSIDVVARNAGDARKITEHSRGVSLEGGKLVGQVVSEMEGISATVNQSAQSIRELGERSQKITAVVGVIRDIADQTNLLALNAAIEAARAGEQGRGFAVVADEVRKLAERTAASTGEISAMVAAIQSGTQAAVSGMEAGVVRVGKGVALAREAGGSMAAVERGAEQVMAAVTDISDALHEQSAASLEMARNVERIAQMAEQNSSVVRDAADTARRLESLAQELRVEVGRFRV